MARAKKTDRAEARRRYRAEHGLPADDIDAVEAVDAETAAATKSTGQPTQRQAAPAAPTGRMSIAQAFRESFRPLDLRGDLRALPTVALRTKALWIPIAAVVGSAAVFIATGGTDVLSRALLFPYFIQTPALGAVFIAGFLAPRASWLLGVIVGFVAAIVYAIIINTQQAAFQTANPPTPQQLWDATVAALIMSPLLGAFFAALAAWYRRFLSYSNPNRGRQAQKAAAGQRPDGKSRTAGAQKAGARR